VGDRTRGTPATAPRIEDGGSYADVAFRGLRLADTTIRDATFTDCVFEHGAFVGATFDGCSFNGCRFETCDLSLARLPNSRFMDVRFVDSKLLGVDWTAASRLARLALSVAFERCVVSQSVFFGVDLRHVVLRDSIARQADFRNADLSDGDCSGTDFSGAKFADTTFTRADFRRAHGYAIDPLHNRLAKARFSLPDAVALLDGLGITLD
jgi:uncharacterized protein YjbI with pentapeptide repeats